MTEVKCSVDSCEFWSEGEICTADYIWVKNNMVVDAEEEIPYSLKALKTEFADEFMPEQNIKSAKRSQGSSADTSYQTCCETMRPRK